MFNATPDEQTQTVPALAGEPHELHPVQTGGADDDVKTATSDEATGTFTVPARTVAVFVGTSDPRFVSPDMRWSYADLSAASVTEGYRGCTDGDLILMQDPPERSAHSPARSRLRNVCISAAITSSAALALPLTLPLNRRQTRCYGFARVARICTVWPAHAPTEGH